MGSVQDRVHAANGPNANTIHIGKNGKSKELGWNVACLKTRLPDSLQCLTHD